MSIHLHGLEVRPTFDGNPLSWLGVDGRVGVGFNSLLNSEYYGQNQLFKQPMHPLLSADDKVNYTYVKVNRHENFQPAGNLWYHDHAMRVTQDNVFLGFAGDYIIHDPKVDSQLPGGKYEVLIVAG
jgi:spore coat protein A, manganese oxidase